MQDTRLKIMEAIARQRTLRARYNGSELQLAPHVLFERHGELFLSALNLSKGWRSDEERRLGQFKLAGLSETEILEAVCHPLGSHQPGPPRPGDVVVLSI